MKLSKSQKQIVNKIASGEITDIYSYIQALNLGEYHTYNKDEIESRFSKSFAGKSFLQKIESYDKPNIEKYDVVDGIYKRVSPSLYFPGSFGYNTSIRQFHYDMFESIYTANNFNDIVGFISLWQYLKTEALIIELPKEISEKDAGLCFDILHYKYDYTPVDSDGYEGQRKANPNVKEGSVVNYWEISHTYKEFIDWEFNFNRENFEICCDYLGKKLYPAPELNTFVQNRFETREERAETRNFLIALAGILIAIITSVFSLLDNGNSKELVGIKNEISKLNHQIEQTINENKVNP